ncbi:MAG: type IV pilin, partial [Candidatus Methanogasteraceae archaeon]
MAGRNLKSGSFKKDEAAVSPVIGVILMVAITVILAAVIG